MVNYKNGSIQLNSTQLLPVPSSTLMVSPTVVILFLIVRLSSHKLAATKIPRLPQERSTQHTHTDPVHTTVHLTLGEVGHCIAFTDTVSSRDRQQNWVNSSTAAVKEKEPVTATATKRYRWLHTPLWNSYFTANSCEKWSNIRCYFLSANVSTAVRWSTSLLYIKDINIHC